MQAVIFLDLFCFVLVSVLIVFVCFIAVSGCYAFTVEIWLLFASSWVCAFCHLPGSGFAD